MTYSVSGVNSLSIGIITPVMNLENGGSGSGFSEHETKTATDPAVIRMMKNSFTISLILLMIYWV
jgi:hypothetical protein